MRPIQTLAPSSVKNHREALVGGDTPLLGDRQAGPPLPHSHPERQLRELEEDGILTRIVFPEVPPRVEYTLTRRGRTLAPVVDVMNDWGKDFSVQTSDR